MALSTTQKRVGIGFLAFVIGWQFWTDPLGLADTANAIGGVLSHAWENFTIFMGALGDQ